MVTHYADKTTADRHSPRVRSSILIFSIVNSDATSFESEEHTSTLTTVLRLPLAMEESPSPPSRHRAGNPVKTPPTPCLKIKYRETPYIENGTRKQQIRKRDQFGRLPESVPGNGERGPSIST